MDAGVLLIGTGGQLEMICEHFGAPSVTSRTTPQQLLCVACTECLEGLPRRASEGVHEGETARKSAVSRHFEAFRAVFGP